MQNTRTTISLPSDLIEELQALFGEKVSFSEQVRRVMIDFIVKEKEKRKLEELHTRYKKHATAFQKSADEHKALRTELTDIISTQTL